MTNRYSEEETERVRERERSSAGTNTQSLTLPSEPLPITPSAPAAQAGATTPTSRPVLGIALFLIGLVALVLVLIGRIGGAIDFEPLVPLASVSAGLLFFAFYKRIYPLIIPGCILAGLSVGVPLAGLTNGASVVWSLSAAFLGVLVLGRAVFGERNDWPLIPAVILFLVGVTIIGTSLGGLFATIAIWPCIALVALGVWLSRRRA